MIQLWFSPINKNLKPISINELKIMKKLSPVKAREYALTRGQIRETLSKFFKIPPLEIPLMLLLASPLYLVMIWVILISVIVKMLF